MTIDQAIDTYLRADVDVDYPDDPVYTDYIQDDWLTIDSWAVTNSTTDITSLGVLKVISTGGIPNVTRSLIYEGPKNAYIRVRGSKAGSILFRQTIDGLDLDFTLNITTAWSIVNSTDLSLWLTPSLTLYPALTLFSSPYPGDATDITFVLSSFNSISDYVEFDWVYIGTGAVIAPTHLMYYLGGGAYPTLTTSRLFWLQAPEGVTLPYVVITIISDTDAQEFFDRPNAGQGRLQVDVVSNDKAGKDIALRIRTLLRHAQGLIGGLQINAIWPINRREYFVVNTNRFVFSADYEVHCEY